MSKKRKYSKKFIKKHPREINKFYKVSDKQGGHPAQVYFIDNENSLYFIIRFTQSCGKGRYRLKHNINPLSKSEQFILKDPTKVKYENLHYKQSYLQFRIHKDDIKIVEKLKVN